MGINDDDDLSGPYKLIKCAHRKVQTHTDLQYPHMPQQRGK